MQIPSDITYVRKISVEIENFLKSNDVDNSIIFDIRLCAEEAINNAIIHGNKKNKARSVFITYSLEGDKFTLEIEDEGEGFDPRQVADPVRDKNLLKGAGRGIFIIRKFMDEVKYNKKGNKIFMAKLIKKKKGGMRCR